MMRNLLEVVEIRGTRRACGRAYGEAFASLITGFCRQELVPDARRLAYARACWPSVEAFAPATAEFLRGEAEGARLSLDHAVLLTLHEEIFHQSHCTAFVAPARVTRERRTIVAQNWDWSPGLFPWAGLLRLSPKGDPRALLYHFPGLWAAAGVNDAGLALMWTSGGYYPRTNPIVGVPTYVLIAEVMRRRSVAEALEFLGAAPNAGCFIFLLGDASGETAVVEGAPRRQAVVRSPEPMVRANHYACAELIRCVRQPRSFPRPRFTTEIRQRRMEEAVAGHRGRLSAAAGRRILTSRTGEWPWLHQFPGGPEEFKLAGMTLDSLLAVCEERLLWTCRGGRQPGPWQHLAV